MLGFAIRWQNIVDQKLVIKGVVKLRHNCCFKDIFFIMLQIVKNAFLFNYKYDTECI